MRIVGAGFVRPHRATERLDQALRRHHNHRPKPAPAGPQAPLGRYVLATADVLSVISTLAPETPAGAVSAARHVGAPTIPCAAKASLRRVSYDEAQQP